MSFTSLAYGIIREAKRLNTIDRLSSDWKSRLNRFSPVILHRTSLPFGLPLQGHSQNKISRHVVFARSVCLFQKLFQAYCSSSDLDAGHTTTHRVPLMNLTPQWPAVSPAESVSFDAVVPRRRVLTDVERTVYLQDRTGLDIVKVRGSESGRLGSVHPCVTAA